MFFVIRPSNSYSCPRAATRGFSLLEVAIGMGVTGILMGVLWQMTAVASRQSEVAFVSSQTMTVANAAKGYISSKPVTLLALPQLAALNSVARIKITSADTGVTTDSLQEAGFLPSSFATTNNFGQSYALFVRREDAGTIGVADPADRLIGLLITTGGSTITDQTGSRIVAAMGAPGGFMYAADNAAAPTAAVLARGAQGGWRVSFTAAGWSTIGALAVRGHLAVMVNLVPTGNGIGGGGGLSTSLDDLSDGRTNYTNRNLFAGQAAGASVTSGTSLTGIGLNALNAVTTSINDTAFGAYALAKYPKCYGSGGYSALGYNTLSEMTDSFCGHTAVGAKAMGTGSAGGQYNVAVGYEAQMTVGGSDSVTAIGYNAFRTAAGHSATCVGAFCAPALQTPNPGNNTAIGAYALYKFSTWTGAPNTVLGAFAGYNLYSGGTNANNNVLLGYNSGSNLTEGVNNIMIGANTSAPTATTNNLINIGGIIHADSTAKWLNIAGNGTKNNANLDFEVVGATNSVRLSAGDLNSRPTCTSTIVGAQRWNTATQTLEFCDGLGTGKWMQIPLTYGSGTPPDPLVGSGFIVLTQSKWNGNLGGYTGATNKCYTELTSNTNWMYYNIANSRGQLTPGKIVAKLVTVPGTANTVYYFSRVGDSTVGGGVIQLDASGNYSGNNLGAWSGKNYFGGKFLYWTGNDYGNHWLAYQNNQSKCDPPWSAAFQNSSSSYYGNYGDSSAIGEGRWWSSNATCDNQLRLLCLVNP